MTNARRRDGRAVRLAAWCWPSATWSGFRDAEKERERADPSEPVMKAGDIRTVRLGAHIGDTEDVERGEALTVKGLYSGQGCGRVVLRQRRLAMEAAALSWITRSPHDVRPYLLLLHFGEVAASLPACIRYGDAYLSRWCDVCDTGKHWGHAFDCAAVDALLRIYFGRDTRGSGRPTIQARAKRLHIGPANYSMLVTKMESAFRMRLAEAVIAFEAQFQDAELLAPAERYNHSMGIENAAAFSPFARLAA